MIRTLTIRKKDGWEKRVDSLQKKGYSIRRMENDKVIFYKVQGVVK